MNKYGILLDRHYENNYGKEEIRNITPLCNTPSGTRPSGFFPDPQPIKI